MLAAVVAVAAECRSPLAVVGRGVELPLPRICVSIVDVTVAQVIGSWSALAEVLQSVSEADVEYFETTDPASGMRPGMRPEMCLPRIESR